MDYSSSERDSRQTPNQPNPSSAQRKLLITLAEYAGAYLHVDYWWRHCKLYTTGHHSEVGYRTFLALKRNNWITVQRVLNSDTAEYVISDSGIKAVSSGGATNG